MATLRVGMVGAGGIARPHMEAWRSLGADVVVFSEQGAAQLVSESGYGRAALGLDDLWEHADIVDIVTPTFTHPDLVRAALDRQKDVICEKPIALDAKVADELVQLAARRGRRLFTAQVVRYFPSYATLKAAVDQGEIGKAAIARFARIGSYPSWSGWFEDESLSGGVITDLAIHDLDIARWINGEVAQVYATLRRFIDADGTRQALTHIVLTHVGGAISEVDGVWGAPGTEFYTNFDVAGDGGRLQYDSRKVRTIDIDAVAAERAVALPDLSDVESPYLTEIRDFIRAREDGDAARVSDDAAVGAIRLVQAAIESANTGEPVALEDVR